MEVEEEDLEVETPMDTEVKAASSAKKTKKAAAKKRTSVRVVEEVHESDEEMVPEEVC